MSHHKEKRYTIHDSTAQLAIPSTNNDHSPETINVLVYLKFKTG